MLTALNMRNIKCILGLHSWNEEWVGYKEYETNWTTVKCCRRCGKRINEIDDLFAPPRSEAWPDIPISWWIGKIHGTFVAGKNAVKVV